MKLGELDDLTAKVTCWQWSGGTITVTTPPEPGETEEEQCARHDAEVEYGMTAHPKTGECQ